MQSITLLNGLTKFMYFDNSDNLVSMNKTRADAARSPRHVFLSVKWTPCLMELKALAPPPQIPAVRMYSKSEKDRSLSLKQNPRTDSYLTFKLGR